MQALTPHVQQPWEQPEPRHLSSAPAHLSLQLQSHAGSPPTGWEFIIQHERACVCVHTRVLITGKPCKGSQEGVLVGRQRR
ncbi:hypothetical protein J4Q44_G00183420 [Coregonus suidteri]|uniref:Uncharacterized protein n=1 Tax=Coregonus suidteri TaxID=861788 RepID=A0AAN8LL51_9TELE